MANVPFISVSEFKKSINAETEILDVVENPKTGKLFMAIRGREGSVGRVAHDIKEDSPMVIGLFTDESTGETVPCLLNGTDNVKFSL